MTGPIERSGRELMFDELVTHAEILVASVLGGCFAVMIILGSVPA
jgi:hypothetical protein